MHFLAEKDECAFQQAISSDFWPLSCVDHVIDKSAYRNPSQAYLSASLPGYVNHAGPSPLSVIRVDRRDAFSNETWRDKQVAAFTVLSMNAPNHQKWRWATLRGEVWSWLPCFAKIVRSGSAPLATFDLEIVS